MPSSKLALLLASAIGGASAALINRPSYERDLHARATTNGSCISAPDNACVSLVGFCVTGIASGQVPATQFWSDRVCAAAATCAGMGPVLDAACCAGTCHQPTDIASLDYNNIYAGIVGDCAFQPGGCSLTWQPFVDWFYNTIQSTNTNIWPESGDVVLGWWANIATWTGFCTGTSCVDGAIPYNNFNDWYHFSSAVLVTTPGTPQYVQPLSDDRDVNDDDWTPDFSWPCPFDDPNDCWWDYGPPTTASSVTDALKADVGAAKPGKFVLSGDRSLATFTVKPSGSANSRYIPIAFGHAEHQPLNVPPPTYVNGQPLVLHLNGTDKYSPPSARSFVDDLEIIPVIPQVEVYNTSVAPGPIERRAITPDACQGAVDTPTTLPTLKYYCNLLPNICANIRSHPDFSGDQMTLTYDPFGASTGARRDGVCTTTVKAAFQLAGKCDLRQHNPAYWKVSCDEFPFNSALEGGSGNAQVMAVPTREQQYQGSLQSSITNLRRVATDGTSVWKGASNRMCHSYRIQLVNTPEAGAPATAVGSLDSGSAFFSSGVSGTRFLTDRRVENVPAPFLTDTDYPATASNLKVPSNSRVFDCRPCSIGSVPPPPPRRAVLARGEQNETVRVVPKIEGGEKPTPTTPPRMLADFEFGKRQASSCTRSTTKATSTPEATLAAGQDISAAQDAAAAAAAAAVGVPAAAAAAAAAAVAAANALAPAAAALTEATSDSAFAAAIAAAEAAIEAAQDAAAAIWGLGPDTPDEINEAADDVISATSSISDAIQEAQDVVPANVPIPPDTDPAKNPNNNAGPPPNAPPAACFGAGSQGFLKIGDTYFTNENGKAPATLVDVGSDAFFGLNIPTSRTLEAVVGCPGVYGWASGAALAPDFQVDCGSLELGSYWNGAKQQCYSYNTGPGTFSVICGNNLGNIYSCLQGAGLYGTLNPAFINWATS
ncbi:hypothetical protein C8Q80DRAFT_1265676 [Daedaleopsis nitida]|nr:hypothetical protein C8Q80DRAFT_1265676 [Daedaleopsis nitida]